MLPLLFALAALNCSDYHEPLGHGCTYRDEGGRLRDILCSDGEIPATATAYAHDEDFVIARQTPGFQDILYSRRHVYEDSVGT